MAETIVFYTHPMSRGRIVRWMLEEIGTPYEVEYLSFGPAMKADEYLAINPMGKVPSIRHGDVTVTECAAICAYLADVFPDADLAPPVSKRGLYYRWLFFTAGPLEAAVTNHSLGYEPPEDKQGVVGYGNYNSVMNTLEKAVSDNRYIAGKHFSAADIYVGSHIGWGLSFGSIERRPAFSEYWSRLSEREAYKRATSLDDAAIKELD